MKYISLITMLLSMSVFSEENCSTQDSENKVEEQKIINTDVPSHLKGAKIIVRLADGRESEVPAEAFKVVPRKQQYLVTKVSKSSVTMCSAELNKNRISILGGRGPKEGLDRTINPNKAEIESRVGTVGGLQYQRMLNKKWSVGVQGQTNKSGLVSIGLDF